MPVGAIIPGPGRSVRQAIGGPKLLCNPFIERCDFVESPWKQHPPARSVCQLRHPLTRSGQDGFGSGARYRDKIEGRANLFYRRSSLLEGELIRVVEAAIQSVGKDQDSLPAFSPAQFTGSPY